MSQSSWYTRVTSWGKNCPEFVDFFRRKGSDLGLQKVIEESKKTDLSKKSQPDVPWIFQIFQMFHGFFMVFSRIFPDVANVSPDFPAGFFPQGSCNFAHCTFAHGEHELRGTRGSKNGDVGGSKNMDPRDLVWVSIHIDVPNSHWLVDENRGVSWRFTPLTTGFYDDRWD